MITLGHSVERTRASRLAQFEFVSQRRLAPAAHVGRYAYTHVPQIQS
jgi:hypothetical protein